MSILISIQMGHNSPLFTILDVNRIVPPWKNSSEKRPCQLPVLGVWSTRICFATEDARNGLLSGQELGTISGKENQQFEGGNFLLRMMENHHHVIMFGQSKCLETLEKHQKSLHFTGQPGYETSAAGGNTICTEKSDMICTRGVCYGKNGPRKRRETERD